MYDWLTRRHRRRFESCRLEGGFRKIPPLTPEGQQRAAARRAATSFDSYENRPLQERCIVWTGIVNILRGARVADKEAAEEIAGTPRR